ncbi:hypothetical protein ACFQPA_01170 [Halomarina halobia]|uniref:Uncharacterized protein n=1 Tax=Halomarina halobia TaxID=3033386 RepID=A0ABD6A6P8_9EURY|nr:hypothetical protein [Halomarina sp. PSR21]
MDAHVDVPLGRIAPQLLALLTFPLVFYIAVTSSLDQYAAVPLALLASWLVYYAVSNREELVGRVSDRGRR